MLKQTGSLTVSNSSPLWWPLALPGFTKNSIFMPGTKTALASSLPQVQAVCQHHQCCIALGMFTATGLASHTSNGIGGSSLQSSVLGLYACTSLLAVREKSDFDVQPPTATACPPYHTSPMKCTHPLLLSRACPDLQRHCLKSSKSTVAVVVGAPESALSVMMV